MAPLLRVSLAVVALSLCVCFALAASDAGHGWGDKIEWHSWEDAKAVAKSSNKPIMLILHKSWCGACKRLRPLFAESAEIAQLSKSFVMVSAEDDEKPHDDATLTPDGGYIPRILFLDSNARLNLDIHNDANPNYKYFYPNAQSVIPAMKQAIKVFAE